jgi:chromosome transmission fidelity protein 18
VLEIASGCEVMDCIGILQVSMQLYSAREKAELSHVISIMIDYNLNYVQERTPEGAYVYNLDP